MKIIKGIVSCKDCPIRYKGCRVFESCSLDQLEHLEKTNTILPDCPLPDSPVEISREEAQQIAKNIGLKRYENRDHSGFPEFLSGFMACFDQVKATGWIPVSDTKHRPEIVKIGNNLFQINVMVCGGEKGVHQYTQKSSSREELAIFFEEDSELKHSGFTHWQPLPEPPKMVKTETNINLTKEEAYQLMEQGHKIAHKYYEDDEFIYMKDGVIFDENGYSMGTKSDVFWREIQKWGSGWRSVQEPPKGDR